jgi:hypothetical protein
VRRPVAIICSVILISALACVRIRHQKLGWSEYWALNSLSPGADNPMVPTRVGMDLHSAPAFLFSTLQEAKLGSLTLPAPFQHSADFLH